MSDPVRVPDDNGLPGNLTTGGNVSVPTGYTDPSFDWSGGLTAFTDILKSVSDDYSKLQNATLTEAGGKLSLAEGKANKSLYEQYLSAFPQYAQQKEGEFKAVENQTLADRLAAMGMKGITTGGAGAPTSAATAYEGEKSLYDTAYETLTNQLGLEQTKAQGQLDVANATIDTAQATIDQSKKNQDSAIGGEIGTGLGALAGGLIGTFLLPGVGTVGGAAGGSEIGNALGEFIGGLI